jgi:type VI secretion system Hcp family effector
MSFKAAKYVLALSIALVLGPQCFAQNNILAKFDTFSCQGAGNADFPNYAAVFSVQFGGTDPAANLFFLGGAGGGKTSFADITLVKTLDDCTPLLFKALANGTVLGTVKISMINPATTSNPAITRILDITLTNVVISSDSFAEAAGGKPSEVVTLSWQKITITHVASNTSFNWDRATNAAF